MSLCSKTYADPKEFFDFGKNTATNTYYVTAAIEVVASTQTIVAVLTDYNNLSSFISSVKESSIATEVTCPDNGTFVKQKVRVNFLVFHKTFNLNMCTWDKGESIVSFENCYYNDPEFERFAGSWFVSSKDNMLVYEGIIKLRSSDTPFFFEHILKKQAHQMLSDVRKEILLRENNDLSHN